jgi:hypothetical protein
MNNRQPRLVEHDKTPTDNVEEALAGTMAALSDLHYCLGMGLTLGMHNGEWRLLRKDGTTDTGFDAALSLLQNNATVFEDAANALDAQEQGTLQ